MKKYISIFLTIIICFGLFSFSAFAVDEKIVVKAVPSTSMLAIGETFTVDFELTTNAGFYTLGLEVDYDKDILEVVCPKHVEGKNCIDSRSPVTNKLKSSVTNNATDSRYHTVTPYKIMWGFGTATEDCMHLGKIATLTFKVKAAPASEKTTISLVVDQSSSVENGKYSNVQRVGVGATVEVVCPSHNYSDWKQVKVATCTEKGSDSRTCSVCNKTETREIAMKEHSFSDWKQLKAATCTQKGSDSRTCSACNKTETRDIAIKPHTFGAWSTSKKATCEAAGQELRSCAKCGFKETRALEKLDHNFLKPVIIKKPTCTENGLETGKCTLCNKQTENILKATGHNISNYTIVESTCTKEGEKQGICSVCGLKCEEKIPLKEHTFEKSVVTKEATTTETGLKTLTCTVCGETKEEIIPSKSEASNPALESSATSKPTADSLLENSSEKSDFSLSETEKIPGKAVQTGQLVAIILLSLSALLLISSTVIVALKKR